ncbi:MAG: hypothetical protein DRO11_05635 [Methanobacteriota archaeon]|nr:MAG: hypothetical protein DRO11_05635 [Euryarchaeota archaeon]
MRDKILRKKLCSLEKQVEALKELGYDPKRFLRLAKEIEHVISRGAKAAAEQRPVETRLLWDKASKLISEMEKEITQLLNRKARIYGEELNKLRNQLEKRIRLAEQLGLKTTVEKSLFIMENNSRKDVLFDVRLKKDRIQRIRSEISRVDKELSRLERRAWELAKGCTTPDTTLVENLVKNLGISKSSAEKLLETVLKRRTTLP